MPKTDMNNMLDRIAKLKIVPVAKINNADDAGSLAEALIAGELSVAEVTFHTEAAEDAIKKMKKFPQMLVGAGTLTSVEQAKKLIM